MKEPKKIKLTNFIRSQKEPDKIPMPSNQYDIDMDDDVYIGYKNKNPIEQKNENHSKDNS